jgi:DNA repair protein SbcD/Mre11
MKFIHCADVHLDTPLQGLAHYPGAPVNDVHFDTRDPSLFGSLMWQPLY